MNQSVYIILCLVPHGGISVEGVSFDEADAVSRCRSLQMEDMGGYYDYAVEKWTDDGTKGERIIYLEGNGA